MDLSPLDFRLVNDWQRDFPLDPRPYARLAAALGVDESVVLARLAALLDAGVVSRIGAVFRPHTLGWSTLAAVAVAPERIEVVAREISAFPEINHNYEREHAYNLWFVATAPTRERVAEVLAGIARVAGGPVLDLPMEQDFHIDLGFDLSSKRRAAPSLLDPLGGRAGQSPALGGLIGAPRAHLDPARRPGEFERVDLESADYALAGMLEGGLSLVSRPYQPLAARLGWSEDAVRARLKRLLAAGVIRRFGVVVRHRELGYRANAMVVWDVPDAQVGAVGAALAQQEAVTLCYRRPRRLPDWRYNLFSMLHGQDRDSVLAELARLRAALGLEHIPCQPLFSRRRFKQCGARYTHLAKAA